MWNSIDVLMRLSQDLTLIVFVLAVLAAAATAARYFVDRRVGELKSAAAQDAAARVETAALDLIAAKPIGYPVNG